MNLLSCVVIKFNKLRLRIQSLRHVQNVPTEKLFYTSHRACLVIHTQERFEER